MRFASVEPSPAALVRATFNFSSPFLFAKIKDAVDCNIHCVFYWYTGRDSNPQPSEPESDALSIEPPVHCLKAWILYPIFSGL